MWTKFNYRDFEEGLFWLLQMSPVYDCDIGISGDLIGLSTGQNKIESVLAWVETGPEGTPLFSSVDPANHGRIDDDGVITHYCEVFSPADGLPVDRSSQTLSTSAYENKHYFENQTNWVAPCIPLNPELRPGFDSTPNDDRADLEIEHWWNKPYIVTQQFCMRDRSYTAYVERLKSSDFKIDTEEEWTSKIEKQMTSWMAAWPSGTRYDVRCLNGGAWDRSSCIGMYATLGDAILAASKLLDY